MLIRRNPLTLLSFVLFVIALYSAGMLSSSARVTHETTIPENLFSVKQGVTQDGTVSISEVSRVPAVPIFLKSANHPRTLRAFVGPSQGDKASLFIESVLPRGYFVISGGYTVSQDFPTLLWNNAVTLQFYGTKENNEQLYRIRLNVHALTVDALPVDPTATSSDPTGYRVTPD
ncbi:MAG: hypothetical protein A2845_00320 [Candidatus Lloydbacteria bacterium RIFCSPHIGHO2_01_FULL_49_22]|uniref:Uncharacterized protein n=1 Tax=Candidatus Lloydbacteria bacterium RIFCSPHIGHO2_01_FULL_49_22 TaxID=1798658 RepID=A0A1G2D0F1_9BACT|nr:MAG: hypothetical protein A2845_00320 [Candidatus Lloydbacteria bacterium RIFCSPHIGHO2_01_FULL_49_22]OGZ09309.1 MAG: hypothetical protein A3C14_05225 [Candidatus Lloydbacteria bacterium RIFCSPHIGHO2_02_FULL_50_18]